MMAVPSFDPTVPPPPPDACVVLRDSLRRWFHPRGVPAFVGCEIPVVHSDGVTLPADVVVTLQADLRPRRAWVSAIEGRAPDVVFLLVAGDRVRALDRAAAHVERGVSEAFVFDRSCTALWGFRRLEGLATPVAPSHEGLRSRALDLHLVPRSDGLRVVHRVASIGDLLDVVHRVERALTAIDRRRAAASPS